MNKLMSTFICLMLLISSIYVTSYSIIYAEHCQIEIGYVAIRPAYNDRDGNGRPTD